MEHPVFRLEGVVKAKDPDFIGPLTLILQLLSKNKIEIRDISISLILQQYLEYLDGMAALNLDIASEFVAMASHLAYIKTKMLLQEGQEISELEELLATLEELRRGDVYAQIRPITEIFVQMYMRGGATMTGPPEYLPPDTEHGYTHEKSEILDAIMGLIGRDNARIGSINPREAVYPQRIVYSISDKITEISETLRLRGAMPLSELFLTAQSRTELVAVFVAVLEICKDGGALITGDIDDMSITYTGVYKEIDAAEQH